MDLQLPTIFSPGLEPVYKMHGGEPLPLGVILLPRLALIQRSNEFKGSEYQEMRHSDSLATM